jgi:hypothetical protein
MAEVKTVVAFPATVRVRSRARKSVYALRAPARAYPSPVVPMFGAKPLLRERRQAGLGMAIAFGFSAVCWAGLAALIF